MRPLIDLREQVVSFPPQPVITSDNLTVGVDSVIYFQVTDPRAATYEIANYIQAVEQLTITTLRNVIGSLNLEQALTSRDAINSQLRGVLDEATGPWGIRVARVEIKAIDPPPSIQDAMEQQMRADRNKRAIILTAEGQRESAIKTAEGEKAAQILSAEGQKQAAILAAEAERQSRILRAEGERAARYLTAQGQAKAIETTFGAIHAAKPDPALLAYQYLQTLPQIAQGDANKMWIVPSEFSKALEGLSRLGGGGEDGALPSWLNQTGTDAGRSRARSSTHRPGSSRRSPPAAAAARGGEPAGVRRRPGEPRRRTRASPISTARCCRPSRRCPRRWTTSGQPAGRNPVAGRGPDRPAAGGEPPPPPPPRPAPLGVLAIHPATRPSGRQSHPPSRRSGASRWGTPDRGFAPQITGPRRRTGHLRDKATALPRQPG